MLSGSPAPKWLLFLERRMGWLAIPNIALLLVTLQALGFFMVASNPGWIERLALIPGNVIYLGEYWRVITFLALPITTGPIWMLIALLFLYSILNAIEQEWGSFRTTLYVLVSILVTIAASFALNYPITEVSDFVSTLFLAAATLFPEMEVLLFFVIPTKLKWLAWISVAFLAYKLWGSEWQEKVIALAVYSNYLIFFGPAALDRIRRRARRSAYKRKLRD